MSHQVSQDGFFPLLNLPKELILRIAEYAGLPAHRKLSQAVPELRELLLSSVSYELVIDAEWRMPLTIPKHFLQRVHFLTIEIPDQSRFIDNYDHQKEQSRIFSPELSQSLLNHHVDALEHIQIGTLLQPFTEYFTGDPRPNYKVLLLCVMPNLRFLDFTMNRDPFDPWNEDRASRYNAAVPAEPYRDPSARIRIPDRQEKALSLGLAAGRFHNLRDLRIVLEANNSSMILNPFLALPALYSLYIDNLELLEGSIDDIRNLIPGASNIKILQLNGYIHFTLWSGLIAGFRHLEGLDYQHWGPGLEISPFQPLVILDALIQHQKNSLKMLGLHSRFCERANESHGISLLELQNLNCFSSDRNVINILMDSDDDAERHILADILPANLRVLHYNHHDEEEMLDFLTSPHKSSEVLCVFGASKLIYQTTKERNVRLESWRSDMLQNDVSWTSRPWRVQDADGRMTLVFN